MCAEQIAHTHVCKSLYYCYWGRIKVNVYYYILMKSNFHFPDNHTRWNFSHLKKLISMSNKSLIKLLDLCSKNFIAKEKRIYLLLLFSPSKKREINSKNIDARNLNFVYFCSLQVLARIIFF